MSSLFSFSSRTALVASEVSQPSAKCSFLHYKYSTHPRRVIILFFVLIFGTLSFGWLLAGLVRLRQTATYSESCAESKVHCATGTNLICDLSSSMCLCPERTFWDTNKRICAAVQSLNGLCSETDQCDTSMGLICSSQGTCQCPQNTYYTVTGCLAYASFGGSCLVSGSPPCDPQLGLVCNNISNTCVCSSLSFWSRACCQTVASYSGYCDRNNSCNTQSGLFCRLPSSAPSCDCPSPSKLFTCDCNQGQTWVSGTGVNGSSACVNQTTYLGICSSNTQCPQPLGLTCIGGVCDCSLPSSYWSSAYNTCLPCESKGYTLIRLTSQWVCTRLISDSLFTFSISQTSCTALTWSLIAPLLAADIPLIAQVYPTYRLWINIQSTLGSSTYVNNIFSTNQPNWNTYVYNSSTTLHSSYAYALQIVPTYSSTLLFQGNTNVDHGHALCAYY